MRRRAIPGRHIRVNRQLWLAIPFLGLSMLGCDEPKAEALIEKESTIAEQHDEGTLYWNVDEDGKAQLVVKNQAGTIITRDLEGELLVSHEGDKEPTSLTLEEHPERGVFTANLKALDKSVTTVEYNLELEGKTVTGALFLPEEGTAELVEIAEEKDDKSSAEAQHGGVVEKVDGRRYEIVANAKSGETRVYLLDKPDEKPKSLELALDVHESERVELVWESEGYYVADLRVKNRPRKVSLIVVDPHDHVHVALVGFHAHVVFEVHRAPAFWVTQTWKHPGKARGHYKGTIFGPPGHYKKHHKHKKDDRHDAHRDLHLEDHKKKGHDDHAALQITSKGSAGNEKGKGKGK